MGLHLRIEAIRWLMLPSRRVRGLICTPSRHVTPSSALCTRSGTLPHLLPPALRPLGGGRPGGGGPGLGRRTLQLLLVPPLFPLPLEGPLGLLLQGGGGVAVLLPVRLRQLPGPAQRACGNPVKGKARRQNSCWPPLQ